MGLEEIPLIGASGSQAEVDKREALLTFNVDEKQYFGWTSVTADIDAGDTAILITNDSDSKHLHIVRAYIYTDVHTQVLFNLPSFGTFTGTAIAGIPLNRAAISVAPATAWGDETGNDSSNVLARLSTNELTTGQFALWAEFDGKVKLGFHDSFSIDIVAEPAAYYSFVLGYFHDND